MEDKYNISFTMDEWRDIADAIYEAAELSADVTEYEEAEQRYAFAKYIRSKLEPIS